MSQDKAIEALQGVLEHFKKERARLVKQMVEMEKHGYRGTKKYEYLSGKYDVYLAESKVLSEEIGLRRIVDCD